MLIITIKYCGLVENTGDDECCLEIMVGLWGLPKISFSSVGNFKLWPGVSALERSKYLKLHPLTYSPSIPTFRLQQSSINTFTQAERF